MKKSFCKTVLFCFLLLMSFNSWAAGEFPGSASDFGDLESTEADVNAAPIDKNLFPLLILGIGLVFLYHRKAAKASQ
jgi:hypothetical protein